MRRDKLNFSGVKDMNVKCAKDHIEQINSLCKQANEFCEKHEELEEETGFLCDVVAFLCDYRKVLEKEIDKAELSI